MTTTERRTQLPQLAAMAAIVAWSFGPLFVRGIDADVSTIVLWRILVALPFAIGVAYLTGGRLSWSLLWQATPTGICFALSIIFGFASFQETSIVNATLIPALQPVLILLVAARLFGERRSRTEIVWSLVALGGVVLVVAAAASSSESSTYGNLLAVGNLLAFTVYFLFAKHVRAGDVHSWSFLAAIFVITAVVITPWSVAVSGGVTTLHGTDWLLILGLVLIPGMVGHGFMTWAHHYVDVSITSMLTLANPPLSILGAWLLFDETLVPLQILGGTIVIGSLGFVVRGQRGARALAAEAALSGDLLDAAADPEIA